MAEAAITTTKKASLLEKVGYGFGDMSSSMFWKIFSYYLPFFYSNIFGLGLDDAAFLLLITRIWDAVSDPLMGMIADRTHTRWGKYRPYLLWVAAPFSICGILLFTTPDMGYAGKLIWAYVTYILMMTVYTGINVPYGSMLGVMTSDSKEKTVFSSFRMFFAYGGSFIALAAWEPLCNLFRDGMGLSVEGAWQMTMILIAVACLILFILCFLLTKERIRSVSLVSVGKDLKSLLSNKPWWLLIGAALCSNLFNTVRGSTVAFFFADIVGPGVDLSFLGIFSFVFYAGIFLSVGEVANMVGVALTVPIAGVIGKKSTFISTCAALAVLSVGFFFVPTDAPWILLLLQILISIGTGIISPLVWSMYADVSDYSELKYHTASTGLIFSSSSMAQKFGSAIGGYAVLRLLGACGYIQPIDGVAAASQPESAIFCLKALMSFIPAAVAVIAVIVVFFYPLTTRRVDEINTQLSEVRDLQNTPTI